MSNPNVVISSLVKAIVRPNGAYFGAWLDRVTDKRNEAVVRVVLDATEM
jgi:hypothetical protein